MTFQLTAFTAALALVASMARAADSGPVAHWDFDEGEGSVLHDRSGNGNDGTIHGATWVKSGGGFALKFDGSDDHVDCGRDPSLDITGPITLMAWVHPTAANRGEPGIVGKFFESYAMTYYGNGYFYISSGGNNVAGPTSLNHWVHLTGTFDGTTMRLYRNGREYTSKKSKYGEIRHGKNFLMGCLIGDPLSADTNLRNTAFFPGFIDDVFVYSRVLPQREILGHYNREAAGKECEPFDMSQLGRFTLEPFYYPDKNKAVLAVNFRWLRPLAEDAKMVAELLSAADDRQLHSVELSSDDPRHEAEAEFSLADCKAGTYRLRAVLRQGDRTVVQQHLDFRYPFAPPPVVPSPEETTVPDLPPPVRPPAYTVKLHDSGAFAVEVKGRIFNIESTYSYPHGGENQLFAGGHDQAGERDWQVNADGREGNALLVEAAGKFYKLSRRLEQQPSRILIRDTFTNLTDDVIGIILSNRVNVKHVEQPKVTRMTNPTIFVADGDVGVGLIALDDLYHLQQYNAYADGIGEITTEHFGLDRGASYTVVWAVYPTDSDDYYDFINQVRQDHGLNRRVEGAFSFVSRRTPPPKELVENRNLAYSSIGCLGKPLDNPATPLEGIEFMVYPKEAAALKETFRQTKALYPGMKVMFHVAHGLYLCNNPEELFPDSRALDTNGRQFHYGPNSFDYYGRYFSQEMFDDNWRWWIFYPTMDNTFGKTMIEAMKHMVGEIGATGMWADGFFSGYVRGGYSYDKWDGHSVTIDPDTKLVTRKQTCVPWVSRPVLREVIRLISRAGGVLVTNGQPGPPSFWNEDYITSAETGGGDARPVGALHLGRSVTPLGNPGVIKNWRDFYRDMLTKLDFGALFFWYGGGDFPESKTLTEHMYPITFESLHAGAVRGKERIVTKKSGDYGWHGDRSLHAVYLYDARGELTRSHFTTTVDGNGVRTQVTLAEEQSAVIAKLPIAVAASAPVNVCVRQYNENAIRLALNGRALITLEIGNGEFGIEVKQAYRVTIGGQVRTLTNGKDVLTIAIEADGPTEVTVERA